MTKMRKLTPRQAHALRAAARHGIVSGGMDASLNTFYALMIARLIQPTAGAWTITDLGMQALESGRYEVKV